MIFRLNNEVGQWVDSQQDLTQLFTTSFKNRFHPVLITQEPFISASSHR